MRLTFWEADLASDRHWADAVSNCTCVLHVASPTPIVQYKHEDEMIIPAREGVLRVLRASGGHKTGCFDVSHRRYRLRPPGANSSL